MNIKNIIQECVQNSLLEEARKNQIRRIVAEEMKKYALNEKETTNIRMARRILNDPTNNNTQIADKVLPDDWADSTKRSYISKLKRNERNITDDLALDIMNTQKQ